jgi:hypothetical protein
METARNVSAGPRTAGDIGQRSPILGPKVDKSTLETSLPLCFHRASRRGVPGNSAPDYFATKNLLRAFASDLVQHQFEWLRPHPKIRAEGMIEDADREEDQGDAHSQHTNAQQV